MRKMAVILPLLSLILAAGNARGREGGHGNAALRVVYRIDPVVSVQEDAAAGGQARSADLAFEVGTVIEGRRVEGIDCRFLARDVSGDRVAGFRSVSVSRRVRIAGYDVLVDAAGTEGRPLSSQGADARAVLGTALEAARTIQVSELHMTVGGTLLTFGMGVQSRLRTDLRAGAGRPPFEGPRGFGSSRPDLARAELWGRIDASVTGAVILSAGSNGSFVSGQDGFELFRGLCLGHLVAAEGHRGANLVLVHVAPVAARVVAEGRLARGGRPAETVWVDDRFAGERWQSIPTGRELELVDAEMAASFASVLAGLPSVPEVEAGGGDRIAGSLEGMPADPMHEGRPAEEVVRHIDDIADLPARGVDVPRSGPGDLPEPAPAGDGAEMPAKPEVPASTAGEAPRAADKTSPLGAGKAGDLLDRSLPGGGLPERRDPGSDKPAAPKSGEAGAAAPSGPVGDPNRMAGGKAKSDLEIALGKAWEKVRETFGGKSEMEKDKDVGNAGPGVRGYDVEGVGRGPLAERAKEIPGPRQYSKPKSGTPILPGRRLDPDEGVRRSYQPLDPEKAREKQTDPRVYPSEKKGSSPLPGPKAGGAPKADPVGDLRDPSRGGTGSAGGGVTPPWLKKFPK